MNKKNYFAASLFLLGILIEIFICAPLRDKYQTVGSIHIKAKIETGSTIELYVNNDFAKSYQQKIVPNEIHEYIFNEVPAVINMMRIDLGEYPGKQVEIFEISLFTKNKQETIPLSAIYGWDKYDLNLVGNDETKINYVTNSNDPFIFAGGLLLGKDLQSSQTGILNFVLYNLWLIIISIGLIILMLSLKGLRFILFPAIFLILFYLFAQEILGVVEHYKFWLQNPSSSVGYSVYSGYSKLSEHVKFFTILMLSIVSGIFFGIVSYLLPKGSEEVAEPRNYKFIHIIVSIILITLFIILNFPDIKHHIQIVSEVNQNFGGFDSNNLATWDYFAQQGLLPYKDYWFPYGGDYLEIGPFTQSILWRFLEQIIIFAVLFYSLYLIFNDKIIPTLAILLFLGIFIDQGIFAGTKRYLLTCTLISFFYAITQKKKHATTQFLFFGAYLGWCFTQETSQLIYSSFALFIVFLLGIKKSYSEASLALLIKKMLLALMAFIFVVGIYFLRLYKNGQLEGFTEFYANLGSITVAAGFPALIYHWAEFKDNWDNVLFIGFNLLAFLSIAHFLNFKDKKAHELGQLLLVITAACLMVYLKMLVRPHMAKQVTCFLFFGFSFYWIYFSFGLKRKDFYILALLGGIITGHLYFVLNWKDYYSDKLTTLEKFGANIKLATSKPYTEKSLIDRFYSYENLKGIEENNKLAIEYLKGKNLKAFTTNIYILGDSSYYYVALKQKPCLFISLYDASGINSQKDVVNCLQINQPEYVIWDSSINIFDYVPNTVRVPLIFKYIIENYVPETTFGNVHILRKIRQDEIPSFDFWTLNLGNEFNLEALPWVSNFHNLDSCSDENCASYLKVGESQEKLKVSIDKKTFILTMHKPHNARIKQDIIPAIYLDRIWFFALAKKMGLNVQIFNAQDNSPVSIDKRQNNPDILY